MKTEGQQHTIAWLLKIFGSAIAALLAAGIIAIVHGDAMQDKSLTAMQTDVTWIRAQMSQYETKQSSATRAAEQRAVDVRQDDEIDSVSTRVTHLEDLHGIK